MLCPYILYFRDKNSVTFDARNSVTDYSTLTIFSVQIRPCKIFPKTPETRKSAEK